MKQKSPTLERFGKNLVRYMKKRNVSTDQLSARTKIPKRTIQHWMHGDHYPKKHGAFLVAKELRVLQTKLLIENE